MRNCPLQAALSRIPEIRSVVLGKPKAWLGTAYHEVLENLPSERIVGQSDDEMIRHFWDSAIADLRNRAAEHPLDRRFASPERWPRYHLVRASLQIRARQLLAEMRTVEPPAPAPALALREQQFVGMEGKLIGKPDVVLPQEIRDYKSGSLYEEDADGIEVVKTSYLRQLRLYGHLVRENRG